MSFRMTLSDLEWLRNIQWHKASRGLSATGWFTLSLTNSLHSRCDEDTINVRIDDDDDDDDDDDEDDDDVMMMMISK